MESSIPFIFIQIIDLTEKAFKMTFSKLDTPSAPLFYEFQILNIFNMNTLLSCSFVFEVFYHRNWPSYTKNYFFTNKKVHNYPTIHSLNLNLPLFNTSHEFLLDFMLLNDGMKIWIYEKLQYHVR